MRPRSLFLSLTLTLAAIAGCSSDNGTGDPTCSISAVAITGAPATMLVGGSTTLGANVTQTNCTATTVAWTTDNASVATVSGAGVVTAVGAGTVTITATSGGKSGTATITVSIPPVASVLMVPDSVVVAPGGAFLFAATPRDAGGIALTGRTIAWSSTNVASATVSGSGLLAALAPSTTTTVTATSEGQVGSAKVWVVRPRLAYFWNNDQNPAAVYEPTTGYSFASFAGAFSVNKAGTGNYTVGYPQIGRATRETEALFVTAYGTPDGYFCRVGGWNDVAANLSCFDAAGTPADARFDFTVLGSATFAGRYGYAWVDDAASATSIASPDYRYSSSGLPITVSHSGAGVYSVRFAGLARANGADREGVIVSTYGGGATAIQCQLGGWVSAGANTDVEVRCFNAAGDPIDSRFDIALISGPRTDAKVAFADADQPAVASYVPTSSAVKPTGDVVVTRSGAGTYQVLFNGFGRSAGATETFHVAAVGTTARRCHVTSWGGDAGSTTVGIACSTPAGVRADTRFAVVGLQ
ncbi:MAG: Ig-like domain-containing protein [Gemmatimonadota bacterium]